MNKKNIALLMLLAIIPAFLVSGCTTDQSTDQPVGGDTDEHGCVLMGGYTWCE